MKADWDDAPIRVRTKHSHLPLIMSFLFVTGVSAGGIYWAEKSGKIDTGLAEQLDQVFAPQQGTLQAQTQAEQLRGKPARSREELLAILQRDGSVTMTEAEHRMMAGLLEETVLYPQAQAGQETSELGRQTEFSDHNYTPRQPVNVMESRHARQAAYNQARADARRVSQSQGLNGTGQASFYWEDARGRRTHWSTSFRYNQSVIDNSSFCTNYRSGSIEYRTCRKGAKQWLSDRCGNGNSLGTARQRMYCHAASGFRI